MIRSLFLAVAAAAAIRRRARAGPGRRRPPEGLLRRRVGAWPARKPGKRQLPRRPALQRPLGRCQPGGDRARESRRPRALARPGDRPQCAVAAQTSSTTTLPRWRSRRRRAQRFHESAARSATRAASRPPTASPKCCRSPRPRTTATGSSAWTRVPALVEQTTVLMREGMKAGNSRRRC